MSNVDHRENAIHNHSSNTISTKHRHRNEVSKIIEENSSENKQILSQERLRLTEITRSVETSNARSSLTQVGIDRVSLTSATD